MDEMNWEDMVKHDETTIIVLCLFAARNKQ